MIATLSSTLLFVAGLFVATRAETVLGTQDAGCQNTTEAMQDPSCWAALGYNAWFDTWKGPCPGPRGCSCDTSKAWSDCALQQYRIAINSSSNSGPSCVDLTRPSLCHIPGGNWAELSEDDLATAYASTAIKNFYRYVYDWYAAITNSTAPAALLDTLSNQLDSQPGAGANQTLINAATFLMSLTTNYTTNKAVTSNFGDILTKVLGENASIDVAATSIATFQTALGQALSQTLDAILSNWNTPYFDALSNNGALLKTPLENATALNTSLTQPPPSPPFAITAPPNSLPFPTNTTTRHLLSTDATQSWNYRILECDADTPNSLATHLSSLLDTMHENLYTVMKETRRGPRSPLGFPHLFHTANWLPIRRLYEHMYTAVGTKGNPAANPALPDNPPVLICLQPHNRLTAAAYAVCVAQPRLRAFQQPGTLYAIGLCPAFWALPRGPVRAFCPYKGNIEDESYSGGGLQLNQQSVLVHQLVRIYLGANVLEPEVFGLRDVVGLSAADAYRNPSTWSYWYSSVIGCTPSSWADLDL